jgi:hypothetical protein
MKLKDLKSYITEFEEQAKENNSNIDDFDVVFSDMFFHIRDYTFRYDNSISEPAVDHNSKEFVMFGRRGSKNFRKYFDYVEKKNG